MPPVSVRTRPTVSCSTSRQPRHVSHRPQRWLPEDLATAHGVTARIGPVLAGIGQQHDPLILELDKAGWWSRR